MPCADSDAHVALRNTRLGILADLKFCEAVDNMTSNATRSRLADLVLDVTHQ
jgi:hypothetical protein